MEEILKYAALVRRVLTAGLLALLIASAAATAEEVEGRYRLRVDGLACPFCAYGIEKSLGKVAGVERVEIDIRAGSILVTTSGNRALTERAARDAVEAAGFTLRGFELDGPSE